MQRLLAFLAVALLSNNLQAFFVGRGPSRVMTRSSRGQTLDMLFDFIRDRSSEGFAQVQNLGKQHLANLNHSQTKGVAP